MELNHVLGQEKMGWQGPFYVEFNMVVIAHDRIGTNLNCKDVGDH